MAKEIKVYWPLRITEEDKALYKDPMDYFNTTARVTATGIEAQYGFYGFTGRAAQVGPKDPDSQLPSVTVFIDVVDAEE